MAIAVPAQRGGREWSTRVQGRIARMVEVPVVVNPVARLDIIGPDDIEMQRVEASGKTENAASFEEIMGQAAKRRLGPGMVVNGNDLTKPILVRRNTGVAMVFRTGRLMLTAQGRAMSDGSEGDLVRVLNTKSSRIVEGIVQSNGAISILPKPRSVASAGATIR